MSTRPESPELLTPAEVAHLFRVDAKTVNRWAKAGWLTALRTLGGHRRFLADEIAIMLTPNREPYGPISHKKQP